MLMLFPDHVTMHSYALLSGHKRMKVNRMYTGHPQIQGTLIWQPVSVQGDYAISYDLLVSLLETWEDFPWIHYFYNGTPPLHGEELCNN